MYKYSSYRLCSYIYGLSPRIFVTPVKPKVKGDSHCWHDVLDLTRKCTCTKLHVFQISDTFFHYPVLIDNNIIFLWLICVSAMLILPTVGNRKMCGYCSYQRHIVHIKLKLVLHKSTTAEQNIRLCHCMLLEDAVPWPTNSALSPVYPWQ